MNEKLVKNIKYLVKVKGLKLGDFEKEIGVAVGYLSRSKKEFDIPFSRVMLIAEKLNVSLDYLVNMDVRQEELKRQISQLEDELYQAQKEKLKELHETNEKYLEQ